MKLTKYAKEGREALGFFAYFVVEAYCLQALSRIQAGTIANDPLADRWQVTDNRSSGSFLSSGVA